MWRRDSGLQVDRVPKHDQFHQIGGNFQLWSSKFVQGKHITETPVERKKSHQCPANKVNQTLELVTWRLEI